MGRRKLRFYVTKNRERKRYGARDKSQMDPVQQPSPQSSLSVSFPVTAFTAAPVTTVSKLHSRLTATSVLPQSWVDMTGSTMEVEGLLFCRLQCQPPLFHAEVAYNIQIDLHLKWTLTAFGKHIEKDECSLISALPSKLSSVNNVLDLITLIEEAKVCVGNPDKQFLCLTENHAGVFLDQSGIILYSLICLLHVLSNLMIHCTFNTFRYQNTCSKGQHVFTIYYTSSYPV